MSKQEEEKDHGGTSLTAVDGVSVSETPQLSHDDAVAAMRHVIDVCTHQTCNLVHFDVAQRILRRLESGDLFFITAKQYADDRFQSLMDGIEVGNLAAERAIEAGLLKRVSPPIGSGNQVSDAERADTTRRSAAI
ncbi:MAG: hypothetical protein RLY20_890 [Verrucomicrobiota bacterium]|jgi:hypothetical protein